MSHLHELTQTHERTVGEVTGPEPALLVLLQRAIASNFKTEGGNGRSRNSAPLDVTALTLWQEIAATVAEHWPGRGDLLLDPAPLIARLLLWSEHTKGTADDVHLFEMCAYWHSRIRDLLEPVRPVSLRGTRCPSCFHDQARLVQDEGTVYIPALLVHLSETPVRAECLVCTNEWLGGELVDLGARASEVAAE